MIQGSSGNVGIGTTTPQQKLVVAGTTPTYASFDLPGNDAILNLNKNGTVTTQVSRFPAALLLVCCGNSAILVELDLPATSLILPTTAALG